MYYGACHFGTTIRYPFARTDHIVLTLYAKLASDDPDDSRQK